MELVTLADWLHAQYDNNYYKIVEQTLTASGLLRCFTFRENPRFLLLFEQTPSEEECKLSAEWVDCQLTWYNAESALLWYSQCDGLSSDLLRRFSIADEPFPFVEMRLPANAVTSFKLTGVEKTQYTPDMLNECIELLEAAYTPLLDEPGYYRNERERYSNIFQNTNFARTELFFSSGKLVGMYAHKNGTIELICVNPNLQSRGYGEQILRSAANAVTQDTKNDLRLTTASKNVKAIALYEKCGLIRVCNSIRCTVRRL